VAALPVCPRASAASQWRRLPYSLVSSTETPAGRVGACPEHDVTMSMRSSVFPLIASAEEIRPGASRPCSGVMGATARSGSQRSVSPSASSRTGDDATGSRRLQAAVETPLSLGPVASGKLLLQRRDERRRPAPLSPCSSRGTARRSAGFVPPGRRVLLDNLRRRTWRSHVQFWLSPQPDQRIGAARIEGVGNCLGETER
jgi:hypothetical protein